MKLKFKKVYIPLKDNLYQFLIKDKLILALLNLYLFTIMILLITTISIISFTFNNIYATEITTATTINNNSNIIQTKKAFNIAVASDWDCSKDAKKKQKTSKKRILNLLLQQVI